MYNTINSIKALARAVHLRLPRGRARRPHGLPLGGLLRRHVAPRCLRLLRRGRRQGS